MSAYSVKVTAHTSEGSGPTASLNVTLNEGREGECMLCVHELGGTCYVLCSNMVLFNSERGS